MTPNPRDAESWTFDRTIGSLRHGPLAARIDLARPKLGLHQLRWQSAALDGQLLQVSPSDTAAWPTRLADAYIRGHDLVAAYEAVPDWPYAAQIYWRTETNTASDGVLASLSLLVSIQTSLLDTHPRIDIGSSLSAEEMLRVSPAGDDDVHVESLPEGEHSIVPSASAVCLLRRLAGQRVSYAEMMPASDFRRVSVRWEPRGSGESRWQLFAEFLEKGVIRRARLQLVFLPRENDVELAAAACRANENRPLPLTT